MITESVNGDWCFSLISFESFTVSTWIKKESKGQETFIPRIGLSFQLNIEGHLLDEGTFEPPINPPKEIVDKNDKKPSTWDEREKIPDPDATKPEDWDENEPYEIEDENAHQPEGWLIDEPKLIPDPSAVKPADWWVYTKRSLSND